MYTYLILISEHTIICTIKLHRTISEFSETPNPAYFYAYFCFCTRKISFRGFSFTLYCHRTSKLNFKDVPRTSEISFVRRNRYPRCPKNCQKARPLLTSCMMFAPPTYWKFATCVDWALRTSHSPLAGVLLTSVSSVAAPFRWLRNHCVYLSRMLSWLIDVCIIKLSSATPENIRWNYMVIITFKYSRLKILNYYFAKNVCRLKTPQHFRELPSEIK